MITKAIALYIVVGILTAMYSDYILKSFNKVKLKNFPIYVGIWPLHWYYTFKMAYMSKKSKEYILTSWLDNGYRSFILYDRKLGVFIKHGLNVKGEVDGYKNYINSQSQDYYFFEYNNLNDRGGFPTTFLINDIPHTWKSWCSTMKKLDGIGFYISNFIIGIKTAVIKLEKTS